MNPSFAGLDCAQSCIVLPIATDAPRQVIEKTLNQRPDLGHGVMCRDVTGLLAEEDVARLETNIGGAQPMPKLVLEVM